MLILISYIVLLYIMIPTKILGFVQGFIIKYIPNGYLVMSVANISSL